MKAILRLAVLLVVCGLLMFSYARYIEPHILKTEEISIYSVHAQPEQKDLTIVAFADTHFSDYYTEKDFAKVIKRINRLQPDFVFFLGDLIDHFDEYEGDTSELSAQLSEITASIGKYAVFGNHDYGGGSEQYYESIMNEGGFQVLVNQSVDFDDLDLTIVGIDDMVIGYGDPGAAVKCRADHFNIVLSHAPDIITEMTDYDIDLMLSGHTHGGQVRIPFYSDAYLPPFGQVYQRGIYHFENVRKTTLYVNSGLGTTFLPLRFMAPPELTNLHITDQEPSESVQGIIYRSEGVNGYVSYDVSPSSAYYIRYSCLYHFI